MLATCCCNPDAVRPMDAQGAVILFAVLGVVIVGVALIVRRMASKA